jgi:uncharacterized protein (DUF4415 family)
MTREQQLSKARQPGRRSTNHTPAVRPTGRQKQRSSSRGGTTDQSPAGKKPGKKRRSQPLSLAAAAEDRKRGRPAIADPEFYRPLKKPVTLRLDADVLAWFKREGRRYQTRINQALRQVMENEVKGSVR